MRDDPALMPATELLRRYRDRSLSPVEATKACLDRIARHNAALNAFCFVDEEGALAAARASERRWMAGTPVGAIDGVPTSVKDLVIAKGWPTLRGSRTVDPDQDWNEDAPSVAHLRAAGAVLMGKTTTPEMGWKGVTDNPLTGITRNPWNPEMTPGGSSGGAAAAAAAGMAHLNIGTDGGGSVRIPASFTGIVGLKPNYGRIPAYPLSAYGTISHVGPMARTVADTALMLQVMAQPDPRDWTRLPYAEEDFSRGLAAGVQGVRVGYAATFGDHAVRADVAARVAEAAKTFEALGAVVEPVDLPMLAEVERIFFHHWSVGAATALDAIDAATRQLMDPGLVAIAEAGRALGLIEYQRSVLARGRMAVAMNRFHDRYDLLLMPTEPIPAFAVGHDAPPGGPYLGWQDWTPFTYPFNLTQQPAISVPCGLSDDGLPVGLHLIAAPHQDALVLRAAAAYESAHPAPLPPMVTG